MFQKEEFENKTQEYFELCKAENKPFTITGVCLYLEIEKFEFFSYLNEKETKHAANLTKTKIENWIEENALSGKLNSTMAIFVLKSIFGWNDKEINNKVMPITIINDLAE